MNGRVFRTSTTITTFTSTQPATPLPSHFRSASSTKVPLPWGHQDFVMAAPAPHRASARGVHGDAGTGDATLGYFAELIEELGGVEAAGPASFEGFSFVPKASKTWVRYRRACAPFLLSLRRRATRRSPPRAMLPGGVWRQGLGRWEGRRARSIQPSASTTEGGLRRSPRAPCF